jgi:hypothetical protein
MIGRCECGAPRLNFDCRHQEYCCVAVVASTLVRIKCMHSCPSLACAQSAAYNSPPLAHIEVIKTIVLAGVSVCLQDSTAATEADLGTNYFISSTDIGRNLAEASLPAVQDLNNFATITSTVIPIDELGDDFFAPYNVILLDDSCSEAQALRINGLSRQYSGSKVFFWSGVMGREAWFIADFGENFEYFDDPPKNKTKLSTSFPSLEFVLQKKWSELPSRHFPLSKTFVKSRILRFFR